MINYVLMPFYSVSRGRKYIYIEESQPDKVNQTAQLSSPFIRGPKCLRFSYRLSGRHVGRLDVLLQVRGRQGDYLMWNKSGDQGSQWIMASVDIGYTDECQVHTLKRQEKKGDDIYSSLCRSYDFYDAENCNMHRLHLSL